MKRLVSRIRQPVKREGADDYLLITLLAFGASVGVTRLFLELTGYPQLGTSTLHIAHVLWGGLLLFAAALLPLLFANRWVYTAGAGLAGIGVGLFIDEVGKFITQTNDYFFPAAAPIIYVFFLLTVMLYMQIRRPPTRSARTELYRAFEALEELLEHDLDAREQAELQARLEYVRSQTDHPVFARLAERLIDVLNHDQLQLVPDRQDPVERFLAWLEAVEVRWFSRTRFRAILIGGLLGLGVLAAIGLTRLVLALPAPESLEELFLDLFQRGQVTSVRGLNWYAARLALEGSVGTLLVLAGVLMLLGREQFGVALGYLSLLLALTTVNLIVFYFDQFSTILTAGVQFLLLLGVIRYRRQYLMQRNLPDS